MHKLVLLQIVNQNTIYINTAIYKSIYVIFSLFQIKLAENYTPHSLVRTICQCITKRSVTLVIVSSLSQ